MYIPAVNLSQFYGIEIEDFAVDVTRLSLWIADHQMNKELSARFHDVLRPTLPLQQAGDIHCGNALRLDWEQILPHENDEEVYLFGNPPYLGAKKQTKEQKADLQFSTDNNKKYKKLDYICGWFVKGAKYTRNSNAKLGFVTTNSITQGEQVSILWPQILQYSQIFYAYTSFKWANSAKGNAGVTVSIIGLSSKEKISSKQIYFNDSYTTVKSISPYLVEGDDTVIESKKSRIDDKLPRASLGSLPLDGGNLIFNQGEYDEVSKNNPELLNYLKKYIGSTEFINGKIRYVLWLNYENYLKLKDNEVVRNRVSKVRTFRENGGQSARDAVNTSYEFFTKKMREESIRAHHEKNNNEMMTIIIPRVSSENRLYVPMGILGEDTVVSDSATAIYDAPIWLLGLLESKMHMVWLENIGGKLETRYRYSAGLVYNTFPVPELSTRRKNEIEGLVWDILDIREEEGGTLAELYGSPLAEKNPKPMNPRLLEAHKKLDKVVERAYKKDRDFRDDSERLSVLLDMYSKMTK